MHHTPLPEPPLSLVSQRKEIRPFEQRTQLVVMETGPQGHLKTHLWSGGVGGGEEKQKRVIFPRPQRSRGRAGRRWSGVISSA